MVLKVYGSKHSTCTRRVLTALLEKNVTYQLVTIDFSTGEHKKPKYMAMQPFGKVPAIDDDGFILFESRAIVKYIAMKYAGQGTPLLAAEGDLKGYALLEQACSLEAFYFDPPASQIAFEKVFKGRKGLGAPDEAQLAKHAEALDTTLAVYDGILSKQKYLAGDKVTVADLFHLPYGKMAKDLGYAGVFEKYSHVSAWFDGLLARESWVKANE